MRKHSGSSHISLSHPSAGNAAFSRSPEVPSMEVLIDNIIKRGHDHPSRSLEGLAHPVTLCSLPLSGIDTAEDSLSQNIEIILVPAQDLIDESLIENIRKANSFDLLNIAFRAGYEIIAPEKITPLLLSDKELANAIIETYCDLLGGVVQWTKAQKPLLNLWRKLSTDLYIALEQKNPMLMEDRHIFTPEKYELVNDAILGSGFYPYGTLQIKDYDAWKTKLAPISDEMGGFPAAKTVKLFLEHIEEYEKELEETIAQPLRHKQKEIQIDTKFLYLDNGHDLYNKILLESKYNDYYKKDIELIRACADKLHQYMRKHYISLGTGNGVKDCALLEANPGAVDAEEQYPASVLLIDGSIKSLREAEVTFTGTETGMRGYHPGMLAHKHLIFSQDWIDKLAEENGSMEIFHSAFSTRNSHSMRLPDLTASSNTFAILGSTFGNFSPAYKKKFLQDMYALMNKGDTLFISSFNEPSSPEEIQDIIAHYDTPQTHQFMKNFLMKLGIPEENIEVQVTYRDDVVHIDALIVQRDVTTPLQIYINGSAIEVPNGTLFKGFESERISPKKMDQLVKDSGTGFTIKETMTLTDNPLSIYVLEK